MEHIKQQLMKETWHRFRHPLVNKKRGWIRILFFMAVQLPVESQKTWLSSPRSQLQSPISLFIHHPSLMQELDSHLWKSQVSQHQSIGSLLRGDIGRFRSSSSLKKKMNEVDMGSAIYGRMATRMAGIYGLTVSPLTAAFFFLG